MCARLNSKIAGLILAWLSCASGQAQAQSQTQTQTQTQAQSSATEVSPLAQSGNQAPAESASELKLLVKPGQSTISVNMATEDIICTNDVNVASQQREHFPDSAEASFIYAVALSRTSRFEDALREVRRARRLAEKDGGPAYFDKMIGTYEKMLTYYPEDNQVRYHLAWAYYMKAYLLARYGHQKPGQTVKYKEWIASAQNPNKAEEGKELTKTEESATGQKTSSESTDSKVATDEKSADTNVLSSIGHIQKTVAGASPDMVPQIKQYYDLALGKLNDLLARDPGDVWARVYRAHLQAEASGDIDSAIAEWQKVKESSPLNPAPYFFLGEGYLKKGNLKECMMNVSRAVALRSTGN